ncbi:MAG: hypothetical protein HYW70_02425 [Candidatus Nealsonbacteria bacterium]|nr:hypothetical protein [Candidatus Nealsonbacteria bacterium]
MKLSFWVRFILWFANGAVIWFVFTIGIIGFDGWDYVLPSGLTFIQGWAVIGASSSLIIGFIAAAFGKTDESKKGEA